jgi:hypothetical protein
VEFRAASWSDTSAVHALMKSAGMSPPSGRRWIALWKENPAYRDDVPPGWVLHDAGGIQGFIGNLPRLMWDGRRRVVAFVPTSWVVDAAARAHSMPLLFQWLKQPAADLLLNTTANREASALFDQMRVPRIPCPALGARMLWVVSYSAWSAALIRRGPLGPLSLVGSLAMPVDFIRGLAAPRAGSDLEWRSEFGPEFDVLWTRIARRPVLQSMRDAENLRWVFGDRLREGRAWLLARADRDGLIGYAVFVRQDIESMRLSRMKLVDLVALDDDPAPFLHAALARCRKEGMHALETSGFAGAVHHAMSRLGAIRLSLGAWPAFWRSGDAALAARLTEASSWYPTLYDGDCSLW